jgi:hypothetical protein
MNRLRKFDIPLTAATVAIALFLGLGTVHILRAQTGSMQPTEAQVLDLQKRFQDASVAVDTATISSLMADDAIFVHGSGVAQTKAEYIASLTTGQMKLSTYQLHDPKVVIFDGGAVVNGMLDVGLVLPNSAEPRMLHMRGSSVWAHTGAGWQLVLSQGTPIAGPPRPPSQ